MAHDDLAARDFEVHANAGEPGVDHRLRRRLGDARGVERESSGAGGALLDETRGRVVTTRQAVHVVEASPRPDPLAGDVHGRRRTGRGVGRLHRATAGHRERDGHQ